MRVFSTEHDIKAFRCDVMFAGSKRSCHVVCCVCVTACFLSVMLCVVAVVSLLSDCLVSNVYRCSMYHHLVESVCQSASATANVCAQQTAHLLSPVQHKLPRKNDEKVFATDT